MSERVKCCPECESLGISARIRESPRYYCKDCRATFAIPDRRERRSTPSHGGISAAGKAALAADPEDVP